MTPETTTLNTSCEINGLSWMVEVQPLEGDNIGLTDYRHQTITIEEDLSSGAFKRTLKHELTHAIIYSYGLDQIQEFSQEILCDFMANYSSLLTILFNDVHTNLICAGLYSTDNEIVFEPDCEIEE